MNIMSFRPSFSQFYYYQLHIGVSHKSSQVLVDQGSKRVRPPLVYPFFTDIPPPVSFRPEVKEWSTRCINNGFSPSTYPNTTPYTQYNPV